MDKGIKKNCSITVTKDNCASAVGSGGLDVFSTPSMIALMEKAAYLCVQPYLKEGESTVGTNMSVTHKRGSRIGEPIVATATITEYDGKKISFSVIAEDSKGNIIGEGIHQRYIINVERFLSNL